MATYVKGQDTVCFYKAQTALETLVAPAATDAIRVLTCNITPTHTRTPVADEKGDASRRNQFEGRRSATVEITAYLRPPAAGGTPQIGELLEAVLGKNPTIVATTSATYGLSSALTSRFGSLYKNLSNGYEWAKGVIFNSLTIAWGNDAPVTLTFAGMATDYGIFVNTTANGAGTSTTSLVVAAGAAKRITPGSLIEIATNPAVAVTAVNTSTHTLTLASAQSWANGATVTSGLPTPTYSEDNKPIHATAGQLSLDGNATAAEIGLTGGSLVVTTGLQLQVDDAFSQIALDTIDDAYRSVRCDLSFNVRDDNQHLITDARAQTRVDLYITLGSTTGRRLELDMPRFELDPAGIQTPEEGRSTWSFSGMAFADATGDNELSAVFK